MLLSAGQIGELIAHWGAILSAACFMGLAVWVMRPFRKPTLRQAMLALGLFTMSLWLWAAALAGVSAQDTLIFENVRNAAWLGFMYVMLLQASGQEKTRGLLSVYAALAFIACLTAIFDLAIQRQIIEISSLRAQSARLILQMVMAVGGLVLVHNLYTVATQDSRPIIAPYMAALAAMWGYDLNLYTISYLAGQPAAALLEWRPALCLLLIPLFMLGFMNKVQSRIRLSRSITFQTLSLMAIGGYLIAMVLIAAALRFLGGDYGAIMQKAFFGIAIVAGILLIPSARFRALMRVQISKHFFQHRYDYRNEWMRFTQTIGKADDSSQPFHARVIKAVADIIESQGGLLLLPADGGTLVAESRWNAYTVDVPVVAADLKTFLYLQETGRIIDFDAVRNGPLEDRERSVLPQWMIDDPRIWVGVPLIHFDKLAGLVLLERAPVDRTLDWEDFDLLRIVGRQVASYLAESQGQEALSEAKRFEEFNRRFAFIIHDIKNLVSQLSLVARNAERHADNPEFRADMIETLQLSVGRMNDLLARLSQHNKGKAEDPHAASLNDVIDAVYRAKKAQHPIVVGAANEVVALVDPTRVEQILVHLVQNAMQASLPTEPIQIMLSENGRDAIIEIMDRGSGMSPDFIRNQLFKPFHSTKDGGFGIGAFEARALAAAMGGRLTVESREGEGSLFRLYFPLAQQGRDIDNKINFGADALRFDPRRDSRSAA